MKEFVLGNIRLLNEDCMVYMEGIEDDSFDLAVTDPDYGLGRKLRGGGYAKRYGNTGLEMGGRPDMRYFARLFNKSREQIVWGGNYFDCLPGTRCFLVWHKTDGCDNFADCEMAWTSFDRNARLFSSARNPKGVSGTGKRIHICQKPVQLYLWILENFCSPGDRIIDTHMGSGSMAIAVYELNKRLEANNKPLVSLTATEINSVYFEAAVNRLRKHAELYPDGYFASEDYRRWLRRNNSRKKAKGKEGCDGKQRDV